MHDYVASQQVSKVVGAMAQTFNPEKRRSSLWKALPRGGGRRGGWREEVVVSGVVDAIRTLISVSPLVRQSQRTTTRATTRDNMAGDAATVAATVVIGSGCTEAQTGGGEREG
jgi:hypothetical protein